MGINYYLHENVCSCCGRSGEALHIGKSSGGWCFSLHVGEMESEIHGPVQIDDLSDWQELWAGPTPVIRDEYGEELTAEEMLAVILEREWTERNDKQLSGFYSSWEEFDRMNHSEPGPYGLNRHKIDGRHCIGHGNGTYDLIIGEFS